MKVTKSDLMDFIQVLKEKERKAKGFTGRDKTDEFLKLDSVIKKAEHQHRILLSMDQEFVRQEFGKFEFKDFANYYANEENEKFKEKAPVMKSDRTLYVEALQQVKKIKDWDELKLNVWEE
jgi:hypothetical protein